MSCCSFEVVSTTTGNRCVRWPARMRRNTSNPPTRGSFRSRSTTAGSGCVVSDREPSASWPSSATTNLSARRFLRKARRVSSMSLGLSSTNRIPRSVLRVFPPLAPKSEIERCALVGRRFGVNIAAVAADDSLDGGQAEARAREVPLGMQSLERREQLVRIRHVEPCAVVAHEKYSLHRCSGPCLGGGVWRLPAGDSRRHNSKLNPRLLSFRGELPRIAEQVLQRQPQQLRVSHGLETGGHDRFDLPL